MFAAGGENASSRGKWKQIATDSKELRRYLNTSFWSRSAFSAEGSVACVLVGGSPADWLDLCWPIIRAEDVP